MTRQLITLLTIPAKLRHYFNRWRYKRRRRLFPAISGGAAAFGQDLFVHELLGRKHGGVFVDVGANDGVTISNTFHFEIGCGWTGLCIEPIPSIYEKLKINRKCVLINGCVSDFSGKSLFVEVVGSPNMLSTLDSNNSGLTSRRLLKNAKRHGATLKNIEVDCYLLNDLAEAHGISQVDFLSIDTEGGLSIIKSLDFDRLPVRVISVENNYFGDGIKNYLESQGFLYLGTFGVDEIYLFGGAELRRAYVG